MTRVLTLKQRIGPVVISPCTSRMRLLECEFDGAVGVIDLDRDTDAGAATVITFLAQHGRCGRDSGSRDG